MACLPQEGLWFIDDEILNYDEISDYTINGN